MREPLIKQIWATLIKEVGEQGVRQAELIRILIEKENNIDPPLNKTEAYYLVKYALTKPIQIGDKEFFEPLLMYVYRVGAVQYRINPNWLDKKEIEIYFDKSARFY